MDHIMANSFQILPSILAADHGRFVEEAQTVDIPEIEYLHIDVMDGHFVPNITFGPQVVASLKKHTRFRLDVHLMIENVDRYTPAFAEAGADIITIHQEAGPHLHRSLALIRDCRARAGVALNPATPLESIRWVLDAVDLVLIMSVNPGFGGQKFIPAALQKIAELRAIKEREKLSFIIEVDGGVDAKTAPQVWSAGAEFLVAGSAVFGKTDRPGAAREIIAAVERAQQRGQSRLV